MTASFGLICGSTPAEPETGYTTSTLSTGSEFLWENSTTAVQLRAFVTSYPNASSAEYVDLGSCSISDGLWGCIWHKVVSTKVEKWMAACFLPAVRQDRQERTFRFLEEALELAQANGCSRGSRSAGRVCLFSTGGAT